MGVVVEVVSEPGGSRIHAPPEWGVEPVPQRYRYLTGLDYFVLWTSLGKGLLVFWAGSLLVPQLDFQTALMVIAVGSFVGSLPLALGGIIGSDNAVPTMVMLRASFGIYGSYLPSLLNIFQLVGWTTFEVVVMALAADDVSKRIFEYSNFPFWVVVFASACTLMGVLGPLAVLRQWLEKFAVWILYGSTAWITYFALTVGDTSSLFSPGEGGLPILLAMDIVVAMPISWMPLVADYSRFARSSRGGFWGTYVGYVIANIIGYGVGALLVLSVASTDVIGAILLLQLGGLALLFILTYEVDNGFADIYSAAVSIQNVLPKARQRPLIVAIGFVSMLLAMLIPIMRYEAFLLAIGSLFIPLFGVVFTDYFLIKQRRYEVEDLYRAQGVYRYWHGFNLKAGASWAFGVSIYTLIVTYMPAIGASIPSLLGSSIIYWILNRRQRTL